MSVCSARARPLLLLGTLPWLAAACQDASSPQDPEPASLAVTVEAAGQPVAAVPVQLIATGGVATDVVTDDAGEAYFGGLDPGSYTVRTEPPPRLQPAAGASTSRSVAVDAGEAASVAFLLDSIPPMIDIDGNRYPVVRIGEQHWTAENLRVERFRNGDAIPRAQSDADWKAAWQGDTPAWTYYAADAANGTAYGKLYNDQAAIDPRRLCADGWHVPTDTEWKVLEAFVGVPEDEIDLGGQYRGTVAGELKSTRTAPADPPRWDSPNLGATNSTGFSAVPGGVRVGRAAHGLQEGTYHFLGAEGGYWTSTPTGSGGQWARGMEAAGTALYRGAEDGWGFSVRCLRD